MDIRTLYTLFQAAEGVTTDTRNINANSLFFALKGDHFDGNDFAEEALDKGALAVVVDRSAFKGTNARFHFVEDVLKSLQALAHHHRKQCKTTVIALTGSNGKTTTKELFKAVLSEQYICQATQGNLNNHIGVPLTLLSIKPNTELAVVEMGANHQGEIATLCEIAAPDWGYITNFGKAHLEGFGGIEGVIKGKTELYHYLIKHRKKILVHADDPLQEKAVENYPVTRFGKNAKNDHPIRYISKGNEGLCLEYDQTTICSSLYGTYNLPNIAAAVALGVQFGIALPLVNKAITHFKSNNNRSQQLEKGKYHFILDAYNANPTSMKAALDSFAKMKGDAKALILGDMLELGEASAQEHQNILYTALSMDVETIYLVGKIWGSIGIEHPKIEYFQTSVALCEAFKKELPKATTLFLKGSRGIALESVLTAFDSD